MRDIFIKFHRIAVIVFFHLQAVMKVIKHCEEEGAGNMEVAQGVLLGLVVDNVLEITNCFPFPRHLDDNMDEGYSLTCQLKPMDCLKIS